MNVTPVISWRTNPHGSESVRYRSMIRGTAGRPTQVPNHPAFLPSGQLVYTDSGDWAEDNGRLYAVSPDGSTELADESACRFPNGLAVSPDGRKLAVVESTLPGVCALSVESDGSLGGREVLVEMPGTVPDGVAWDVEGWLVISCWAPDAIYVLEPGGELSLLAHDPLRFVLNQPTNIAFGLLPPLAQEIRDKRKKKEALVARALRDHDAFIAASLAAPSPIA